MRSIGTLILACVLMSSTAFAGHLPGGNITYECVGAGQYEVTLTLFRDCGGNELIDQALKFASDCGTSFTVPALPVGTGTEVSQLCPAQLPLSSCSGGDLPGFEVYQVVTTVPLGPCNSWTISWNECCRTTSLNLSGNPGTYVEARLNNASAPCNNSPVFTQDVVPYVCVNEPVNYNLAVTESDGHMLRYRLIDARQHEIPVNVQYANGLSGIEPYPGLEIDSLTGQITFTPTAQGKIFVAVLVDEYLSNGVWIGSVMRDFPFEVIACANQAPDPAAGEIIGLTGDPETTGPMSFTMCSYGAFCFDAEFTDADDTQSISLTSNVNTVLPGATFSFTGTNPAVATICWEGTGLPAGDLGFVITAEDNACPNTGLTTFAYSISVIPDNEGECLGTSTGIIERAGMLRLTPVPATDQLWVAHDLDRPVPIRIVDLNGRIVLERTIPAGRVPLDVTALAPGAYVCEYALGSSHGEQRIIIAR